MKNPQKMQIKRLDPYKDLPKAQRKKVIHLVRAAKLRGKIPKTVQQSIPYEQILADGLLQVDKTHFNRSIEFFDVNYKLANDDDKGAIFNQWCGFLNYFDDSISLELSFVNKKNDIERLYEGMELPQQNDNMDVLREEYTGIVRDALSKGNNGLIKRKFLTFSIEEQDIKTASDKLFNIEQEILKNFKLMHVRALPQNGYQRMEVIFDILNMGTDRRLNFNWGLIPKTGFTTKDFISPASLTFKEKRTFELENVMGRASSFMITASEFSDSILSELLGGDYPMAAAIHINGINQFKALTFAKAQLTDVDTMKQQEQRRNSGMGVGMEVIPFDIKAYSEDAEEFIKDLQSRNERMFTASFIFTHFAEDKEKLDAMCAEATRLTQKFSCELMPLDWRQEQGLMSCLPLGVNEIQTDRILTTTSTAIFIPFETCELNCENGLFYGRNSVSQNIITIDRKSAKNPNGLILGTPGSGKGMSAKSEIVAVALCTNDDILIIDPEREYSPLVEALGGQVIKISADSAHHLNPFDISYEQNKEDLEYKPVAQKCDFLLSFFEQIYDDEPLSAFEKTIIDRCVLHLYERAGTKIPTLSDLYEDLQNQPEPDSKRLAGALERYVLGSLNVFNNPTNVDINNRIVCFDIKDLGEQLKKIGMLVTQDAVWQRVTHNRSLNKKTRYYIDEFHLLLGERQSAAAAAAMWKRFRKWGGIPTGITQNVKDFLSGYEVENIFENSDYKMLLNQAPGDQKILAEALNISPNQMSYVTNVPPGEGLIIFDGIIVPFKNHIPEETELYKLMTTKPEEMIQV